MKKLMTITFKAALMFTVTCCICNTAGAAVESRAAADAFKLRMQGKTDDAKALLEKTVRENPHDAAAYYELARIELYMATANPQRLADGIKNAQESIETAIKNDPNNVIYPFFAGHIDLFKVYMSGTKDDTIKLCGAFESALKLKPDYRQAMLYLVEIYGTLPEDKGGDKVRAEQYAKKLEGIDPVFGAKAGSVLLPKGADRVDYWQKVLTNHQADADVLEEMGKAYLAANKVDDAVLCFEKAVKINPEKSILFLDLSIHHTWAAMRAGGNAELLQKEIAAGNSAVTRYLTFKPSVPMEAYALGIQSKYMNHSGQKEKGQGFLEKAKALDPYFSKATGAPNPDLFIGPDEISHYHRYLFRPIQ